MTEDDAPAIQTDTLNPVRILFIFSAFMLITSCGSSSPTTQSVKERLEEIEGKELTVSQVSELVEKADFTCDLTPELLTLVWSELDEKRFLFQDFAFEIRCPDKKEFYTAQTGRLREIPR